MGGKLSLEMNNVDSPILDKFYSVNTHTPDAYNTRPERLSVEWLKYLADLKNHVVGLRLQDTSHHRLISKPACL